VTFRFEHSADDRGLLIRLVEVGPLRTKRNLPCSDWSAAGKDIVRAVRALVAEGHSEERPDGLFLPHPTVADLPQSLSSRFKLPEIANVSVTLRFEGRIDTSQGKLSLAWSDADGRPITPQRFGALLEIGGRPARLTRVLYDLCEGAEAFNATAGGHVEKRIAAWGPLQDLLEKSTGTNIRADGYARSLSFYQAGAFALDVVETARGPDFSPVLMSRRRLGTDDEAPTEEIGREGSPQSGRDDDVTPLLPPELQRRFAEQFNHPTASPRDAYVLARNAYAIVPPDLKVALDVVRAKRAAPEGERRAFLRNPRASIADALESCGFQSAPLFVETEGYSQRIEGLGVWREITLPPTQRSGGWLPEYGARGGERSAPPEVSPAKTKLERLRAEVERAEREGRNFVEIDGRKLPLREAKTELETASVKPEAPVAPTSAQDDQALVIKINVDGVEFEVPRRPRLPLIETSFPHQQMRRNKPKAHQLDGFTWLVQAWVQGWPGVLLADDMGLGKTYQALAFLAWARANIDARGRQYPTAAEVGPMMVVAPTALLRTWRKEANEHLAEGGLGEVVEAFGAALKHLKTPKTENWMPEDSLDLDTLRGADWILTTYETLADNHRAFARIPYSVVVFDEIQKIKEPGSINTQSAKTLNIDFVMGLTGTPIENRLEDLWSIFDRLAPGYLGALRAFSQRYGAEAPEALRELKSRLDNPAGEMPPPMLRGMKDATRDGLPQKFVKRHQLQMPPEQVQAYDKIIEVATIEGASRASMLKVLHGLRGVSLHPRRAEGVDTSDRHSALAWIGCSARLSKALEILRDIAGCGDKALVFVEDLEVQRAFAESVATLFDLDVIPATINGGVAGEKRQAIVDRFQAGARGFDLLMLSPRAAGVGLTITAANHVIHLSRWWNPAVEDQCNDRAYRIGAKRDVTIHLPMALHPNYGEGSFDVKLDQLLERKRALSRNMLLPPESDGDLDRMYEDVVRRRRPGGERSD
jgi:superfamily II DNA or RNA helicase